MTLQLGTYEAISRVNIRREPRITSTNIEGALNSGTQREILSIQTDAQNQTWGRISEPDASGISLWVCIQIMNKTLMKPVSGGIAVGSSLESRVAALEAFARTQGFHG